jgi:hypothetical protein
MCFLEKLLTNKKHTGFDKGYGDEKYSDQLITLKGYFCFKFNGVGKNSQVKL